MIGVGFLFLLLVFIIVYSGIQIYGPEDLNLIGLNESEIFLGEGDICSPYSSPNCKTGLICELHPNYPDADGRCIKPNITGVYNIRN